MEPCMIPAVMKRSEWIWDLFWRQNHWFCWLMDWLWAAGKRKDLESRPISEMGREQTRAWGYRVYSEMPTRQSRGNK